MAIYSFIRLIIGAIEYYTYYTTGSQKITSIILHWQYLFSRLDHLCDWFPKDYSGASSNSHLPTTATSLYQQVFSIPKMRFYYIFDLSIKVTSLQLLCYSMVDSCREVALYSHNTVLMVISQALFCSCDWYSGTGSQKFTSIVMSRQLLYGH